MSLTSSDYLEPGFPELELGDNVEDPLLKYSGAVVQAGADLKILWSDNTWEDVEVFQESMREEFTTPYRVQRRDWDLDVESIHDAVYFGTDLEPNA